MGSITTAVTRSEKSLTELMQQPIPHPVFAHVIQEVCRAKELHAPMNSAHEAYSVILEEMDELWEEIRKKRELRDRDALRTELIQVAAMACRAVIDLHL